METDSDFPVLYSPSQVARRVGVQPETIRTWIKRGRIRAIRLETGRFRIPADEVARLAAGRPVDAA